MQDGRPRRKLGAHRTMRAVRDLPTELTRIRRMTLRLRGLVCVGLLAACAGGPAPAPLPPPPPPPDDAGPDAPAAPVPDVARAVAILREDLAANQVVGAAFA